MQVEEKLRYYRKLHRRRRIYEPKYKVYNLHNFRQLPQVGRLTEEQKFAIEVVAQVFAFKTNNYVVEELINWDNVPDDPIYILTFPQKGMLKPHHFEEIAALLKNGSKDKIKATANKIRWELNPHSAGQIEYNVPMLEGEKLEGMQHKYRETVLFFPSQGQTCHAYCSFCFRWPQFVGIDELKFATRETELLVQYLREHPEVTDVLFTGGDPLIMKTKMLATYIEALLDAQLPNLRDIRIGSKALAYWPYRFLTDEDADDLLALFKKVKQAGKHLAFMAHFNHPREQNTQAVQDAIARIQESGAEIRTQAPLLAHINDQPQIWQEMWSEQVQLGCIPYYMFVVRDTGAQHYFGVPLVRAWEIFREAYQKVTGLARTVRGPTMSTNPGKVQLLGVEELKGEKVFMMRLLQGRDPDWVQRPFFAKFDENAIWPNELQPAFGEKKFFFEEESEVAEHRIKSTDFWE